MANNKQITEQKRQITGKIKGNQGKGNVKAGKIKGKQDTWQLRRQAANKGK